MKYSRKFFGAVLVLVVASMLVWLPSDVTGPTSPSNVRSAAGVPVPDQARQDVDSTDVFVSEPVTPSLTVAAADLPAYEPEYTLDREVNPRLGLNPVADPNYNPPGGPDPLLAAQEAVSPASPDAFGTPLLNFNGQGYSSVNPPDTIGEVGPNHYVQMINGSGGTLVRLYNKSTGATIGSQFVLDSLATSGACQTGLGDPIVLYDKAANRWMLSEFASSGNHLCVYVSRTPDPAGQYYFYDFTTPNFPDYPKYAVWSDAYYVSTNENSPAVYALNRTRMLAGQSATFQRFTAPSLSGFNFQALTPADLDGATAPPAGSPGLFMRHRDTEVHGPSGLSNYDLLELWAFHVDWTTPSNSTFGKIADIQTAEFDSTLCGLTSFSCIPQPGTSTRLDPLREVVMWRLVYRNFGSRQVLVGNFSTDVNGADRAGIRWFELRKVGSGAWSLYQQGTYAPGTINRWMGAIAMDGSGNIALGYNVGGSSDYPGLRYAGRLASDSLGTLPQGEYNLVTGTASNGSNRYGDYSSMNLDPTDDCTFWFTGQWNAASQWSTRIGKFKFDQCGQATLAKRVYLPVLSRRVAPTTGTVAGRVTNANNSAPIAGAEVCVVSSSQCSTTGAQGNYSIANVAPGSRTISATASGFVSSQQTTTVVVGATSTVNFALTPNPTPIWTIITTENFESTFPKAGWSVNDYQSGYGEYYWGKRSCRPGSGSYSGWGVGGGANGASLSCGSNYPNYAFSWLVYGPFSLASATDAELLYDRWVNSELDYDLLFVGASLDGDDFYGTFISGNTSGWGSENFDLTDVYTLGNLTGESSVWIAFVFASDYSITYPEGAHVDNIVLRKLAGSRADAPAPAKSCDVARQASYAVDPCASLKLGVPPQSSK